MSQPSGLIERRFVAADGTRSRAIFSPSGRYRYWLSRRWGDGPALTFIMLNPSTADERANDPTIARCEARARRMQMGAVRIVNLFALRATDPKDLRAAGRPVGPHNATHVRHAACDAGLILAAWGVHGTHRGQDVKALDWLRGHALHALGTTKDGHPRHPLYVRNEAQPQPWPVSKSGHVE